MKHNGRTFLETEPQHCYDWLPAEAAVKHALAALYTVARAYDNLPSDPHQAEAQFENGRYWFGEEVCAVFRARIMNEGFVFGAPGFGPEYAASIAAEYGPGQVFASSPYLAESASAALFYPRRNMRNPPDIHRALSSQDETGSQA